MPEATPEDLARIGVEFDVEERMDEDETRRGDQQAATDEPKQPDDKRERGVRRSPADRQMKGSERDR